MLRKLGVLNLPISLASFVTLYLPESVGIISKPLFLKLKSVNVLPKLWQCIQSPSNAGLLPLNSKYPRCSLAVNVSVL